MKVWRWLQRLFHWHDWQLRVDDHRIYLACSSCPATTRGIRIPSSPEDEHAFIHGDPAKPKPRGVIDARTPTRKPSDQSDRYFN